MTETRRHPDLFTAEEALQYLHLDAAQDTRTLETLRDRHNLIGIRGIGRELMYHRVHLDAVVARLAGMDQVHKIRPATSTDARPPVKGIPQLKLAGDES